MTAFWCESAWLPDGLANHVRVVLAAGRIRQVRQGVPAQAGDHELRGVVLPGFADAHSHAFHRALRGRTGAGEDFWTWRRLMYQLAARLDPDSYLELARACYAELALAGVSCIGEFHYLHHAPGGARYADPNAMSAALAQAAADAGVRLTLLDTCYLAGGLEPSGYLPLDPVQLRFGDGDAASWAARTAELTDTDRLRHGAAVHSVRAVPADQLGDLVKAAAGRPLHVHLSEQPAENAACVARYGCTPTELLDRHGVLGPRSTAVHATHLTAADIRLLADRGSTVCACPSTEADLADGIGPFGELRDARVPLCLGSDQHVAGDLLAETRGLEWSQRLRTGQRGRFAVGELVDALTVAGHRALGWDDAGRIAAGCRADLVAVALDTPRTAGVDPAQAVLAAGAADVTDVVVDGTLVVQDGEHLLGDVGALLAAAIDPLWEAR